MQFSPASGGVGGLLAMAGGLLAVASAWLPWWTAVSEPFDTAGWGRPAEVADGLASGRFLVAAGALAAVCGLLLTIRLGRRLALRLLLSAGALAGAVAAAAVEYAAYLKLQDLSGTGQVLGWGLWVGFAAALLAGLGGLAALVSRPGGMGATVGGWALVRLAGLVIVVAIVAGGIIAWPQLSRQLGLAAEAASAPTASTSPTPPPATPTPARTLPVNAGTTAPSPDVSGWGTGSPSPLPSATFLSGGHPTAELAIGQFVSDQGYTYAGPCRAGSSGSDYCSQFIGGSSRGSVYAIGGTSSEAELWLLLRQVNGQWYVVEAASASNGSPPPWH